MDEQQLELPPSILEIPQDGSCSHRRRSGPPGAANSENQNTDNLLPERPHDVEVKVPNDDGTTGPSESCSGDEEKTAGPVMAQKEKTCSGLEGLLKLLFVDKAPRSESIEWELFHAEECFRRDTRK